MLLNRCYRLTLVLNTEVDILSAKFTECLNAAAVSRLCCVPSACWVRFLHPLCPKVLFHFDAFVHMFWCSEYS